MSAVYFQPVDDEKLDDSRTKRDFIKHYYQYGGDVSNKKSNIKFYFGENRIFIQVGNGYLEFDIKIRKADNTNFAYGDVIRLAKNSFAYTIHDARIHHHQESKLNKIKSSGL